VWWDRAAPGDAFSVEEGIAETLGWHLGDTLTFSVADTELTGRIASLRRVDWDSFAVNFFMLVRPGLLDTATASYVTSFRLPEARPDLLRELTDRFPTVTPIDVSAIMAQVRALMDRASLAVESVFLLTLLAGLTVFVAAFQASRGERLREVALLRSFGASRRQVLTAVTAEFLIMGALAGLVASIAAAALGAVLAELVFELPYRPSLELWLFGLAAGIGIIGGLGLWLARDVLRRPPLRSLMAE
jgi:putative ABC transport system permease protein